MAVDLVFSQAPLTTPPIGLVFNESAAPSLDRQLAGAGTLPGLSGAATIDNAPVQMAASGYFPLLAGTSTLRYNSDTQRPVVGTLRDAFQNGIDFETGVTDRMQNGLKVGHLNTGVYQDATPIQEAFEERWQDATHLRRAATGRYQNALPVGTQFDDGFQDAIRRRQGASDRYQQGVKLRNGFRSRFQDTLRRGSWAAARYQQATPSTALVASRVQMAKKISGSWDALYQDAIRPRPGLWFRPPVIPTDPCYTPKTNLVFVAPWSASTSLVFLCERHGGGPDPEPGDTVIVPVRRIYTVINSASLRRVDGNVRIPCTSMSLSIDVDAWTWGFTASVPGSALSALEPGGSGPVEVAASINGVEYRAIIEERSRTRGFGASELSISGRGKAALLDSPYSPVLTFTNANARTLQQLANDVLSQNGVGLGWDIEAGWQPDDWLVPAGAWSFQGSRMAALNAIAAAAGSYVQPHRTDKALSVLRRYPAAPWDWGEVTPDFELPGGVVQNEGATWVEKPVYNRVFVRGMRSGVLGQATRQGTAGDLEAPMVTDQLITSPIGARQRALPVLADVGQQATMSLRLPVLAETGIIPPGKFVRYVDGGVTRIGLVRSVAAEMRRAGDKLTIWQTIGVETHVGL